MAMVISRNVNLIFYLLGPGFENKIKTHKMFARVGVWKKPEL